MGLSLWIKIDYNAKIDFFIIISYDLKIINRNVRATGHNVVSKGLGLTNGLPVRSLSPFCSLTLVYKVRMVEP